MSAAGKRVIKAPLGSKMRLARNRTWLQWLAEYGAWYTPLCFVNAFFHWINGTCGYCTVANTILKTS